MNKRQTTFNRSIRLPLLLAGLLIFLLPASGNCQFNLSMVPHIADMTLKRGQRIVLNYELTNENQNQSLSIRCFLKDMTQESDGAYKLSDSVMPYSCLEWLTLPDTLIEIGAGETRKFPVEIQVPFAARGGAYGAVVFEIVPEKKEIGPQGVADLYSVEYIFQLPGWIEITIESGRAARGRLTPAGVAVVQTKDIPRMLKQYGDRGMIVTAEVENTGNVRVFTSGRMIIRDADRRLVRDTRLGSGRGAVLPGAKSTLKTITKLPPPGKYFIKTIVEYGGRSPAIAEATFEISDDRAATTGKTDIALPLDIDLRPDKFDQSVPVGGFRVLSLSLVNREQEKVQVDVGLAQISYDKNGNMWVDEDNIESGRSCASWLTIEPKSFELPPNGRKNIRISLKIPEDASGGYYSCVVLNSKMTSDDGPAALPSPIHCPIVLSVPPELEYAGEIVEVKIEHPTETAAQIKAEFRNTGNVHTILSGGVNLERWVEPGEVPGLIITDSARYESVGMFSIDIDSNYVLPGETRIVNSQIVSGLPEGKYRAQIAIMYGTESPVRIEKEFKIERKSKSN